MKVRQTTITSQNKLQLVYSNFQPQREVTITFP